jgi:uncharacterized protein (TIGR00297 family)
MEMLFKLAIGLAVSGLGARTAYRRSSLSRSGAWSAVIMGTGFVALGGPLWFGLLLVFFGTSTYWSKWKRRHKAKEAAEAKYAKSGRRDAGQVWANGGVGLAICALHALWPEPWLAAAFIGVMAAVNADTWATEIGALSGSMPRSILNGRKVPAGTSGGITLLGTAAALAGAACIGAAAAVLALVDSAALPSPPVLIAIAGVSGLFGALVDSLLGATLQGMYRCTQCGIELERAEHCGKPAYRHRGLRFMTNDIVNCASSVAAGLCAAGMAAWLA